MYRLTNESYQLAQLISPADASLLFDVTTMYIIVSA